jgi:hypothetical protein
MSQVMLLTHPQNPAQTPSRNALEVVDRCALRREVLLIRPSQVAQVPVDKLPTHLCFGDMNEVLICVSNAKSSVLWWGTYSLHGVVEVAAVRNFAL